MWGFDGNFFGVFSGLFGPFFGPFLGTPPADHHGGPLKIPPFLYILFTLVLGHILHKKYVGI